MTFLADRVTNVPTSFRQLRMKDAEGALQEGVVGANDLKIVQRAAGANMSVDFSVGAGYIQIDSGTRSGLAHFYNDAVANVAVTASNATNPRIDQAIVRYNDSSIPAGTGGNTPTPEILPGTATGGATLDNRTGAAALPNDCLRLADILVPATSTSVTTANIRDRRPWARGARSFSPPLGTNAAITATGIANVSVDLVQRVECNGANPLRVTLHGYVSYSVAATTFAVHIGMDGTTQSNVQGQAAGAGGNVPMNGNFLLNAPAGGSHLFSIMSNASAGGQTITFLAGFRFLVEEVIGGNQTSNGAT